MTAAQIAAKHRKRAKLVEKEFTKTARGIAVAAVKFTKQKMTEEIYAIPEDVTSTGKKKWKRTGRLLRGEKATVRDAYTVVVSNKAPYGLPRHEAGKPGARKINPLRESHWRDELVETFRSILTDYYELTMRKILEAK